ncbi:MAG: hypothetical protein R6X07_02915, partial [Desulfatiglandales bacterium]
RILWLGHTSMQSKQPLHRSRSISILPFAFFSAAIGEPLYASKRVKKIYFILSGGIFVNQYFSYCCDSGTLIFRLRSATKMMKRQGHFSFEKAPFFAILAAFYRS